MKLTKKIFCRIYQLGFRAVLPVLTYDTLDEAIRFINARPHSLACYLFTESKAVKRRFLAQVPFGGVGSSGMGSYHGKRAWTPLVTKRAS